MLEKNNAFYNNYENNKEKPFLKNRKLFNNNNLHNIIERNINNENISLIKKNINHFSNSNKSCLFQNENLTINKIPLSHIQYKPLTYNDGGIIYENLSKNQNNNIQNNFLKIKKNEGVSFSADKYNMNEKINKRYLTTEISDNNNNKYRDIYGFKSTDNKHYKKYLKNPYYRGEEINDGCMHYNPEENDYDGSRFGGYIYNYYLNAPMRSDKTENWRFPPLYYFRSKFK